MRRANFPLDKHDLNPLTIWISLQLLCAPRGKELVQSYDSRKHTSSIIRPKIRLPCNAYSLDPHGKHRKTTTSHMVAQFDASTVGDRKQLVTSQSAQNM